MSSRHKTIQISDFNFTKDEQGYLWLRVNVGQEGVIDYEGQKEFKSKEELYEPQSIASLINVPVHMGHSNPKEGIGKNLQGTTTHAVEKIKINGVPALQVGIKIYDRNLIDNLMIKKKEEIPTFVSAGYLAETRRLDKTQEYNGETYDLVQTNIRYNHIAILDERYEKPRENKAVVYYNSTQRREGKQMSDATSRVEIQVGEIQIGSIRLNSLTVEKTANTESLIKQRQELGTLAEKYRVEAETAKATSDALKITNEELNLRLNSMIPKEELNKLVEERQEVCSFADKLGLPTEGDTEAIKKSIILKTMPGVEKKLNSTTIQPYYEVCKGSEEQTIANDQSRRNLNNEAMSPTSVSWTSQTHTI